MSVVTYVFNSDWSWSSSLGLEVPALDWFPNLSTLHNGTGVRKGQCAARRSAGGVTARPPRPAPLCRWPCPGPDLSCCALISARGPAPLLSLCICYIVHRLLQLHLFHVPLLMCDTHALKNIITLHPSRSCFNSYWPINYLSHQFKIEVGVLIQWMNKKWSSYFSCLIDFSWFLYSSEWFSYFGVNSYPLKHSQYSTY